MEKERTIADDMIEIASKLNGEVEFSAIIYKEKLLGEAYRGKSINDLRFVDKKFGLYFYTSSSALHHLCYMKNVDLPVYVLGEESMNIYEIKK